MNQAHIDHITKRYENVNITNTEGLKVAFVFPGAFTFHVVESRLHFYGTRKYAQYDHAVWLCYTEKRKRKIVGRTWTDSPIVILKGWVASEISKPSEFEDVKGANVVTHKVTKSRSFDGAQEGLMDDALAAADVEILADYRGWNHHRGA